MTTLKIKDGDGNDVYLNGEGAGTELDPFNPQQHVLLNTNNASGDAFGRLRVSNPETLYSQKFIYGASNGVFFDEQLNGTGTATHSLPNSCVDMAVTSNGDFSIRQSRQRINYQAGKSQLFYFTGILNPEAGTDKRIGCFQGGTITPFNVLDGICFETIDTDLYVKIYKGGAANGSAVQSAWNLDPLDGTGPSGVTLDTSKAQIFIVDFEWLGVGRVRMGFNINGVTHYVHQFLNANNATDVYMRSPNQPIRYELRSTGSAGTMKQICCSVQSEGGRVAAGLTASLSTPAAITVGTGFELLKAIRLKSSQLDATVLIEKINTIASSSGDYEYAVCWNPIIAGTPAWTDITGGALQEWNGDGSTHNVTPLIVMDGGFNSSDIDSKTTLIDSTLRLGSGIDGVQDVIALAVRTLTATETFWGSLNLRQLI